MIVEKSISEIVATIVNPWFSWQRPSYNVLRI